MANPSIKLAAGDTNQLQHVHKHHKPTLNHYERYSCSSNFYDLDPPFRSVLKFQAFFRNQQMDDRPGSVLNLDHPTILVDHPAPMSSMIIPYGTYYDLFYHSLVVGWSSKYDIMYIYIYIHIPNHSIPYHTITVQYSTLHTYRVTPKKIDE